MLDGNFSLGCGPGTDYPKIHIFDCRLDQTDVITNEVLEPITFVLAYLIYIYIYIYIYTFHLFLTFLLLSQFHAKLEASIYTGQNSSPNTVSSSSRNISVIYTHISINL